MTMSHVLAVTLGGAVGSGCRYLVTHALSRYDTFPFGTLSVNVLGCFTIGVLTTYFGQLSDLSPALRLGILVGFLGGFTTFSSFGMDAIKLLEAQRFYTAGLYIFGSNLLGLLAIYGGMKCVPGGPQ